MNLYHDEMGGPYLWPERGEGVEMLGGPLDGVIFAYSGGTHFTLPVLTVAGLERHRYAVDGTYEGRQ